MPSTLTAGHEISSYFKTFDSYMKNEFELLGYVVAELMRNSIPVTDRSIISSLTRKLETEASEENLFSYRKVLEVMIAGDDSKRR